MFDVIFVNTVSARRGWVGGRGGGVNMFTSIAVTERNGKSAQA